MVLDSAYAEYVDNNTVMTSLININSPLVFDSVMMGALEIYAKSNQACIVSPFIVGGAMSPVSVSGTLTQVLAEALAGIAYTQIIRKGAPAIFGAFVSSIDMNSGAPTFGTPEASKVLFGAGQLARRLGLPFRSGGALCGSKLPDAQAAYETNNNSLSNFFYWSEGSVLLGKVGDSSISSAKDIKTNSFTLGLDLSLIHI